eukprot:gene2222-2396_t
MEQVKDFVNEETVLNAYIFGSRAYGTDTQDSDWDYIFVVTDDFNYKLDSNSEKQIFKINDNKKGFRIMISTNDYNISLYKKSTFTKLVEENMIWVLFCIHVPKEFILKEKVNFKTIPVRFSQIQKSILTESSRCWRKAKNLFKEKQYIKAKKLLVYTFMYIDWGIQIYKYDTINDNSCAKEKREKIIFDPSNDWKHFEQLYLKEYLKLEDDFTSMMSHKFLNLSEIQSNENSICDLKFILNKYSPKNLIKEFSISSIFHFKYSNLCRLELNEKESPLHYDFVQICNHIVVDQKNDWKIVVPPSFNFENEFEVTKKFKRFYSFEVKIFYYKEEWICSPMKNDLENEFWRIWNSLNYQFPNENYVNYCFTFDLISIKFPFIFKPQKDDLILVQSQKFIDKKWVSIPHKQSLFNWNIMMINIDESIELNPTKETGLILTNENGNFKFEKSISYLSILSLKNYLNEYDSLLLEKEKYLYEILWNVIRLFPEETHSIIIDQKELKPFYNDVLGNYKKIIKKVQPIYDSIKSCEKIEFFKKSSKYKFKTILFDMKNQNLTKVNDILKYSNYQYSKINSTFNA